MEQYFPYQVITFQVLHENMKQTKRKQAVESLPFCPFFLALELLDDSEIETNDILGEGDDIAFKSSTRLL